MWWIYPSGNRATLRWLIISSALVVVLVGHVTNATAATTTISTLSVLAAAKNEGFSQNGTTLMGNNGMAADVEEGEWYDTTLLMLKASIMIMIIVASIFGNLLVIVSVMRVRKLR